MRIIKWARTRIEKRHSSQKAISTIMANLLMLVIVVFLSAMLFVWASFSFGAYQGGAGYWFSSRTLANQERIAVEMAVFDTTGGSPCNSNCVKVYVRNVGRIALTIDSVYLNSTIYAGINSQIGIDQITNPPITVSLGGQTWQAGKVQKISVVTERGTLVATEWVP